MLRFLAALFEFLNRFLTALREQKVRDEGRAAERQDMEQELQQELEQHVEQAQQAASDPTPVAVERMRSRFDRSRTPPV